MTILAARQLTQRQHDPIQARATMGRGVPIATHVATAPRLGGLSFTRSSFDAFFSPTRKEYPNDTSRHRD